MSKIVKSVLIYADGRIEEIKQDLVGARFLKTEPQENGDWWEREFDVEYAHGAGEGGPVVAVGLERSFMLKTTAEENAKRQAEFRDRVMKECLWGIRNYPGDDVADKERQT